MPKNPEPTGAPDQLPFLRWARDAILGLQKDAERQASTGGNTDYAQNSTMQMLQEKLGDTQASINGMIASATFDGSQITSGTIPAARISGLDASDITTGTLTRPVSTSGNVGAAGFLTSNAAWTNNLTAVTRLAVWMDSNGTLGQTSSTERFKKDIEAWSPAEQAVLAMELVKFHWRPEFGPDSHWEYGFIAEQLHELGLEWLVVYDDEGLPFAVQYERIALALLPVVQTLAQDRDDTLARLNDIEARLATLEG